MNNDTQSANTSEPSPASRVSFGDRLRLAREALGLEREDIAGQLRLNEKFIIMMEKDRYSADLPATFIRGYLRSYAKFLQIPEHEINKALEPIQPKPMQLQPIFKAEIPVTSNHYFMQLLTYLIFATAVGFLGFWCYTNILPTVMASKSHIAENTQDTLPISIVNQPKQITPPVVAAATSPNEKQIVENIDATPSTPSVDNTIAHAEPPTVKPNLDDKITSNENNEELDRNETTTD